jgi:Mg-chelatase subunit ChlD
MFHRIRENEGLQNWNLRKNVSSMEFINEHLVENYAVLFTLDISGSMQGHRWNVTRHATIDFIKYLENNDVVSSVVFNESPHLVMHWSTK